MMLLSRINLEDSSELGRKSMGRSRVVDETMWLPMGCSVVWDCDETAGWGLNTVADIWYSLGSKLDIMASISLCVGLVLVNTVDMDGSLVVGMLGSLVGRGWL